jgi:hypothetical protein
MPVTNRRDACSTMFCKLLRALVHGIRFPGRNETAVVHRKTSTRILKAMKTKLVLALLGIVAAGAAYLLWKPAAPPPIATPSVETSEQAALTTSVERAPESFARETAVPANPPVMRRQAAAQTQVQTDPTAVTAALLAQVQTALPRPISTTVKLYSPTCSRRWFRWTRSRRRAWPKPIIWATPMT